MDELVQLMEQLRTHLPVSWEQFPDFPLYMDQVLSYMDRQVLRFEDDDGLTSAMVNNYTKAGLLPRAEGKKYNQEHLAYLTVICILKRVMSAKDMGVTLEAQLQQQPSVQEGYERFRESLSEALNRVADEMERFPGEEKVADAAVRFALMSYAAGLASSYYVARLRETTATNHAAEKKPAKAKRRNADA